MQCSRLKENPRLFLELKHVFPARKIFFLGKEEKSFRQTLSFGDLLEHVVVSIRQVD